MFFVLEVSYFILPTVNQTQPINGFLHRIILFEQSFTNNLNFLPPRFEVKIKAILWMFLILIYFQTNFTVMSAREMRQCN